MVGNEEERGIVHRARELCMALNEVKGCTGFKCKRWKAKSQPRPMCKNKKKKKKKKKLPGQPSPIRKKKEIKARIRRSRA